MKDLKIFTNNIEDKAKDQIELLLNQEAFRDCKIRIMPDVHAGTGCVIGFTGDLGDKVIPNIVGVDIGCGMICLELGNIELDLEKLDKVIHEFVPSGMNVHKEQKYKFIEMDQLICLEELKNKDNWLEKSIGTLGGGNHFIEVDIDENNNKYLVIHTGSRNLGKQVAEIYQNKAIEYCSYKEEMRREQIEIVNTLKAQGKQQDIQQALISIKKKYEGKTKLPKDLCYLEGKLREDYLHDMKLCQEFASLNRKIIASEILDYLFGVNNYTLVNIKCFDLEQAKKVNVSTSIGFFETIHNYISFEDNIVRKGAISAKKGEKVLIPMNMRDGCIIAFGKGNDDWNQSAPHGAGRIMSRMKAKETFKLDEFKESMKDIYTTSVNEDTIDEAPFVYKSMKEIIDAIEDTVEIVKIITPVYNFKAN